MDRNLERGNSKGLFSKEIPAEDGPYLSLNPSVTDRKELGPEPSADVYSKMKMADPKLSASWTIWEQHKQSKDRKGEYSDAMKQTVTFGTVKEFWACWNHIPQPSVLLNGKKFIRESDGHRTIIDSLAIFKKGVLPEWEDPENANGGHFQLTLKPQLPAGIIDELWNNIVLGMVADAIEPASMITGCRLVDKLDNKLKPILRIEVWFNEMDDDTLNGGQGKVYDLRGSFERCIRLGLDGRERKVCWGRTDLKPHNGK
uniref:Uncharacterized protein n=1 Tax=Zooxanthella nutricula TaxID=1333877 RepID=A0A6U6J7R8_9DINO|mmetsp:Transcript_22140/g.66198  ORF Transcript_22140/g.66198 Transcript_22140/m.66198 type:complete len:257 (+) Transcript_22140:73-843(+)